MCHAPRPRTCTIHTSSPPTCYYYTTGLRTIRRTSAALARSRCLGARKGRRMPTCATAVASLSMGQPRKTARSSSRKRRTGCRSYSALPNAPLPRRSVHVVQVRSICSKKTLIPRKETLHSQDCCANSQELVRIPRTVVLIPRNWYEFPGMLC